MDFSRRRFLSESAVKMSAFGLMTTPLGSQLVQNQMSQVAKAGAYRGQLAIMQSLTTRNSAQFVVLTEANRAYGYQVSDSLGKTFRLRITRRETRKYSTWGIEKFVVTGLTPKQNYFLDVIDPSSGRIVDRRTFQSLETNATGGRFVIASCMKDSSSKADLMEVMWDHVQSVNPQIVFLVGDTCYADNDNNGETDSEYWRRYVETRSRLSHFRQQRLIPTLATWDDHDFGGNNSDGTWTKKDFMKDLFGIFWGAEVTEGLEQGPGVSQMFAAFGQRFYMMDSRSFRSPRDQKNNPVQWGRDQEDFLLRSLSESKDPAWLMNGSQFFGGYLKKDAFEYWQGENLKQICSQLSQVEAPVAFASGDVHFSEFMKIEPEVLGYETFELTSSSIHSTTIIGQHLRGRNKRRIDATSVYNFVVVDTQATAKDGWKVRAQCVDKKFKVAMDHQFVVKR